MSCDWFLVDAPQVVPSEFRSWEMACGHLFDLCLSCVDAPSGSSEFLALDAERQAAEIECDRLEQIARDAWKSKR
jgi:hypothetical protein